MKELVTEEQANLIILLLSIAVTAISLGYGFFQTSRVEKNKKKLLWANVGVSALVGPAIWGFWQVYNSIENLYGLDSLHALKINFFIAVGLGVAFFTLYYFVPRWMVKPTASKRGR